MKVFVTGATGVIGKRLVPLLQREGHDVTALARNSQSKELLWTRGIKAVEADLFDPDSLASVLREQNAVVNLATHMPERAYQMIFRRYWRANDRIRAEGASNLAFAAAHQGCEIFIQESFAYAYPDSGDRWVDEDVSLAPDAYDHTVINAEKSAEHFAEKGGRGIVLRFAAFYGPDAMQVDTLIKGLKRGIAPLPGGPTGYVSSISHDDAAAAVCAALRAKTGAYNVTDDEPLQRHEFAGSLSDLLDAARPAFPPRWTTPLFGCAGATLARSLRLSNKKIRNATGWAPRFASVRAGWQSVLEQRRNCDLQAPIAR